MKRRWLMILVVFSMMLAVGVMPVLAQSGNVDISKTEDETTVTYEVNLTPNASINAADITISYDPNQLAVSGLNRGVIGTGNNTVMATNHVASDSLIYISYASSDENAEGGTICTLTFNKLEGYQSPSSEPSDGSQTSGPSEESGSADSTGSSTTQSQSGSSTGKASSPAIGVDVVGAYNREGKAFDSVIVTGDSTVAVVASGKKITDADANPQSVALSDETIPEKKMGISKTNPDISNDDLLQTAEQKNTATGSNGTVIAIVIVGVLLIGAGVVLLIRRR